MALKLELCIAIVPQQVDSYLLECLSSDIMRTNKNCYVRLGGSNDRLSITPHLTLYQFPVMISKIDDVVSEVEAISKLFDNIKLNSKTFNYNANEGSFEIIFHNTDALQQMQNELINEVNKLRKGLLIEKAPDGFALNTEDDNIRMYGFSEVHSKFKPHATLNWFDISDDPRAPLSKAPLPEYCIFDSIGLFTLGPNGTIPQRLASFPLRHS